MTMPNAYTSSTGLVVVHKDSKGWFKGSYTQVVGTNKVQDWKVGESFSVKEFNNIQDAVDYLNT